MAKDIKIIEFANFTKDVLKKRGNSWNSKRYFDYEMFREEVRLREIKDYCIRYVSDLSLIDRCAAVVEGRGVTDICMVATWNEAWQKWGILAIDNDDRDIVLFNASLVTEVEGYITDMHKKLERREVMITRTGYLDWDDAGFGGGKIYENVRFNNTVTGAHLFAKPLDIEAIAKGTTLTLDLFSETAHVTEDELEKSLPDYHGYKICPGPDKPHLLEVNGKILCRERHGVVYPYIMNAEKFLVDSYTQHKDVRYVIQRDEYGEAEAFGLNYRKGELIDWR